MSLEPREYQQRSLNALETYLRSTVQHGARRAFVLQTDRPYQVVQQLPDLPYVCLRVPTGGGKTFMACHAVGIAARTFLHVDRAVCLWLVPSNIIRDQTLNALRNRQNPYRQAVDSAFAGQVRAVDLNEALYLGRGDWEGATVIIVSTLQALRREDTEGLRVYRQSGNFQSMVADVPQALRGRLECYEHGEVIPSLANVFSLFRPLVIIDEAHNARTRLSFDTLARFNPSCIVEFTATPETTHRPEQGYFASNVLHHVSAAELKAAEMIKLPIRLKTRSEWKEVVGEALETQHKLEEAATAEERESGEYIRPIVLFQAQPRREGRPTLTVDVVKRTLIDDFKVPENQIAVATGETREIDDVDLFHRQCPIRFIITVQALKEGWDCSFAYVLCSVAEISSTRAVEQILGRILRLPRARWNRRAELNCAYAFAASQRFLEAANALKDALIENGFQRMEASDFIVPQEQPALTFEPGSLFFHASEPVTETPSLSSLDPSLQSRMSFDGDTGRLSVSGALSESETRRLQTCFERDENRAAVQRLFQRGQGQVPDSAVQREPFRVPWLAIRVDGQLELFEENHFLDAIWNLAQCDAALSETDFPSRFFAGTAASIDVTEAGRIETEYVEQLHESLQQLYPEPGWTLPALANWIDRQIPHLDIPQAQSSLFIANVLTGLVQARFVTVEQLARQKYRLRNAIEEAIDRYRRAQAKRSFDRLLFGPGSADVEVTIEFCFIYEEARYSPTDYYDGAYRFRNHFYRVVGDLESEGEQFECAVFIDQLPQTECWIRNLERRPESSFWLQTSSDRFYPDFLVRLKDGRILVVEYKGEHLWGAPDAVEKRKVGDLWAERSNGRCLFIMPQGPDWGRIQAFVQ